MDDRLRALTSKDDSYTFWDLEVLSLIPIDAGKVITKRLSVHTVIGCETELCEDLAEFVVFVVRDEPVIENGELTYFHYTSACCAKDRKRIEAEAINGELIGSKLH